MGFFKIKITCDGQVIAKMQANQFKDFEPVLNDLKVKFYGQKKKGA